MTHRSEPALLVLHAVRVLGYANTAAVADRAGLPISAATGLLQEAEQQGWVQHSSFADLEGWSLTDAGTMENERQLAAEREHADPEHRIGAAFTDFLPLNARLLNAVTSWQISPTDTDAFAPNDHSDHERDAHILAELTELSTRLGPLVDRLTDVLMRFDGYASRFETALSRAKDGHNHWIDRTDVDSCHLVWFQLHEDLIATLGRRR